MGFYRTFSSVIVLIFVYFSVFRFYQPNHVISIFVHIYICSTLGFLREGSKNSPRTLPCQEDSCRVSSVALAFGASYKSCCILCLSVKMWSIIYYLHVCFPAILYNSLWFCLLVTTFVSVYVHTDVKKHWTCYP